MRLFDKGLFILAAAAAFFIQVSGPAERDPAAISVGIGLQTADARIFRGIRVGRIVRTVRNVGRQLGGTIRSVGRQVDGAIRATGQIIGSAIRRGGQVIGAIGRGIGQIGQSILGTLPSIRRIAARLKDLLTRSFQRFSATIASKGRRFMERQLRTVMAKVAGTLGLSVGDLRAVVDLRTGRVNGAAAKRLLLGQLSQRVDPFLEGRTRLAIDQVFRFFERPLERAVRGVVGFLGTIPFAGGALAVAAAEAFNQAKNRLKQSVVRHLARVAGRIVRSLLGRGFDTLARQVRPLAEALRRVVREAGQLQQMLGRQSRFMYHRRRVAKWVRRGKWLCRGCVCIIRSPVRSRAA